MELPNLMPHQEKPFNGDKFVEKEFLRLKKKFNIINVIETGTCFGSSTIFFAKNFDNVRSIEINKDYLNIAKDRCEGHKNIMFHEGSSDIEIEKAILELDYVKSSNTIFFLDAHWEGFCPLEKELDIISDLCVDPVIAIHDFKVPNDNELGCDSYNGQEFTFDWLEPLFKKIYRNGYDYYYNTSKKSEGAKRGVIYLHKKD